MEDRFQRNTADSERLDADARQAGLRSICHLDGYRSCIHSAGRHETLVKYKGHSQLSERLLRCWTLCAVYRA